MARLVSAWSSQERSSGWPNDDYVFEDTDASLFAVFDAGGPTYGGYHRPTGVEPGWEALRRRWLAGRGAARDRLVSAALHANAAMFQASVGWQQEVLRVHETGRGELTHPASSLTAVGVRGSVAAVIQVGSSRAWRLRAGQAQLLLDDHTLATQWRRAGRAAEVEDFHRAVVTRMLGLAPKVDVDSVEIEVQTGDAVLVCSDGIWQSVGDERLLELAARQSPGSLVEALVKATDGASSDRTALCIAWAP